MRQPNMTRSSASASRIKVGLSKLPGSLIGEEISPHYSHPRSYGQIAGKKGQ
jgi:hypothetical protein